MLGSPWDVAIFALSVLEFLRGEDEELPFIFDVEGVVTQTTAVATHHEGVGGAGDQICLQL